MNQEVKVHQETRVETGKPESWASAPSTVPSMEEYSSRMVLSVDSWNVCLHFLESCTVVQGKEWAQVRLRSMPVLAFYDQYDISH